MTVMGHGLLYRLCPIYLHVWNTRQLFLTLPFPTKSQLSYLVKAAIYVLHFHIFPRVSLMGRKTSVSAHWEQHASQLLQMRSNT